VGDVVLRFEPFILTAECRTREAGQQARTSARGHRLRGMRVVITRSALTRRLCVMCRCARAASPPQLVATALAAGFRESGVSAAAKRVVVTLRCSIRLEASSKHSHTHASAPTHARTHTRFPF
jgi:hypothetical protein